MLNHKAPYLQGLLPELGSMDQYQLSRFRRLLGARLPGFLAEVASEAREDRANPENSGVPRGREMKILGAGTCETVRGVFREKESPIETESLTSEKGADVPHSDQLAEKVNSEHRNRLK